MALSGTATRFTAAVAASAGAALLFAPGALGATVTVNGSTLAFDAAAGERNTVIVRPVGANFRVADSTAQVIAGAGCTQQEAHRAVCPLAGITLLDVVARDGDDEARIVGTTVDARLDGGSGADRLTAAEGNDTLIAGSGSPIPFTQNEFLFGGDGSDTLFGTTTSSQFDTLLGEGGDDDLLGGAGIDTLHGGPGADLFRGGGQFNDTVSYVTSPAGVQVSPETGADDGTPGEGDNVADGIEVFRLSPFDDVFTGGAAGEQVSGDAGEDLLLGGGNRDTLVGGSGFENDTIRGQAGDDGLEPGAGPGEIVSGGSGTDQVSFGYHFDPGIPFAVSLDDVPNDGAPGENKNVRSDVEDIIGTPASDTLIGNDAENRISGENGADHVSGLGGDDRLFGDQTFSGGTGGVDTLAGGVGDDVLTGGIAGDVLNGQAGFDFANYNTGSAEKTVTIDDVANDGEAGENDNVTSATEGVLGGSGDDELTGSSVANALLGGSGSDQLQGAGGDDFLEGDPFSFNTPDSLGGGGGLDTASYSGTSSPVTITIDDVANDGVAGENDNVRTSVENLIGGGSSDVLTGNGLSNVIAGRSGDDTLNGAGGPDYLAGEASTDTLNGQNGNDQLDTALDGNTDTNNCGNDVDGVIADAFDTINPDCEDVSTASPAPAAGGSASSLRATYDGMLEAMRLSEDAAERSKDSGRN